MTSVAYTRYQETAPGCDADLSDNTNLFGVAPSVSRVLGELVPDQLTKYPSAYSNDLKRSIGRYAGVDESMIVVGCGSDDVLDSAIRAFGSAGDLLIQADPTFSMIPVFAAVSGLNVKAVTPRSGDFAALVRAEDAAITYLCSPNNPTGEVLSFDIVESIARNAKGLVIIDEAYIEFGGTTAVPLLADLDNVLITRTFSKAFGLAGLRVGYGLGSPALVERVEAARGPYKVTAVSEKIACAVMDNDLDWVTANVNKSVDNRQRFAEELRSSGFDPLPSGANFIMVPVADGKRHEEELRAAGVAVRRFSNLTDIGDALRISIGPWNLLERCAGVLRGIAR